MRIKKIYDLAGSANTGLRFAVISNSEKFLKHKHAWKVWRTLKGFGCTVYPIAPKLDRLEGSKVYPDLQALQGKVDIVIPCLKAEDMPEIVNEAKNANVTRIWFQERNWTKEFQAQCEEAKIEVIRGCVLKHKIYPKPFGYLNPCYWHGLHSAKAQKRW